MSYFRVSLLSGRPEAQWSSSISIDFHNVDHHTASSAFAMSVLDLGFCSWFPSSWVESLWQTLIKKEIELKASISDSSYLQINCLLVRPQYRWDIRTTRFKIKKKQIHTSIVTLLQCSFITSYGNILYKVLEDILCVNICKNMVI